MFLPKLREIKEALASFFTSPYTTKFPAGEYTPHKNFRGFPHYHEEDCIGCGACSEVCPAQAITYEDNREKGKRILTVNYAYCFMCGMCEEFCTTETGIQNESDRYSFSTPKNKDEANVDSVEKELVFCESCGDVIACRDHISFTRERLGTKAFTHPTLMLDYQREFTDLPKSFMKDKLRREDYMKEVCAKCRHKIVVEDEL